MVLDAYRVQLHAKPKEVFSLCNFSGFILKIEFDLCLGSFTDAVGM